MAILKTKEIEKMNTEERQRRIVALKRELVKAEVNAAKNSANKVREIKKAIARIKTLNNKGEGKNGNMS